METKNLNHIWSKLGLAAVGKPALIGLAAIVIMVAVFAGRIVIDAATATEIPIDRSIVEDDRVMLEQSNESSPSTVTTELYVHVSGAVKNPGLVIVAEGSRVVDAVEAAGGFSKNADEESVNLARKVADGEHIQVFKIGEEVAVNAGASSEKAITGNYQDHVNINSASEQELQSLPGIGPATASKIIDYRNSNGPFSQIDELKNVSGIGDKKFESIEDLICV